jgi:uncharacterized protein (TIGR02145 family)
MKNFIKPIGLFLIIITVILHSCKKDKTTPPILSTTEPTEITQTTVTSGGNINSDGGEEIISAGICWSTSTNPSVKDKHTNDAKELGNFTSKLTGLTPDTKYYIRAYAVNKTDIGYGNEISFTTSPIALATLSTANIDSITSATAVCGGNITFDGGGAIIERGICWAIHQNPTTDNDRTLEGTGTGSFTSDIKCLSFATTYYVRAYAINSAGTAYGNQLSFTTPGTNPIIFNPDLTYGSVTDIEGNCYKTIQIGNRIWMAENLRTGKYNDGVLIPEIINTIEWSKLCYCAQDEYGNWTNSGISAFCWYNNDKTYDNLYGKLYNWYAVKTDILCPVGWHVPTFAELMSLVDYTYLVQQGSPNMPRGECLMEVGTAHWDTSGNFLTTNESGFTAIPAGYRGDNGIFTGISSLNVLWASDYYTIFQCALAYRLVIPFVGMSSPLACSNNRGSGLSVRCIKDN